MTENQKLREALLSDMDIAVLRMPIHMAFAGDMAQFQYHNRVQALLKRIEALALPPDVPETTFRGMREALQLIAWSNDSKWQADCARQALATPTADHLPDAGKMVVDHFPDATKMIETAVPVGEQEAFEQFAQNCPMGKYNVARRGEGYDSSHTQIMWDAWQARAVLSDGDAVDAQRLDFIEKSARCDPKMDGQHVWWPTSFNTAQLLKGPTLREAIDNAIRARKDNT